MHCVCVCVCVCERERERERERDRDRDRDRETDRGCRVDANVQPLSASILIESLFFLKGEEEWSLEFREAEK